MRKYFDGANNIEGHTIRYREDPILLDPRNKNLGARLVINLEKLYLSIKKMELISLANTKFYPGRDEFYDFCPNIPSIFPNFTQASPVFATIAAHASRICDCGVF